MQVLMTILYILLFLVFLSILIIIHELGHLAAAKAFNVFCLEYSIGMGPLLFKRKRKNGETQFSIRAIPFGGYVSMYGEGVTLPEGVVVDESRSLNGIKAWKRAIILLAGVTMNAVLALNFFFISNCFPEEHLYRDQMNVQENTAAAVAGVPDGIIVKQTEYTYHDTLEDVDYVFYLIDDQAVINGDDAVKYAACFNFDSIQSFKDRELSEMLYVYELKDVDGVNKPNFEKFIKPETISYIDIHLISLVEQEGEEKLVDGEIYTVRINQVDGKYQPFGCLLYYDKIHHTFGQIIKGTFVDFGECSILLFKTIGQLFTTKSAWDNIGGIVAVGFETTSVLKNLGFGKFIYYWGFISVNLAVFNLLPFPGLDGWQLLVLVIETTTKKKIPEKVKNIVSLIGIGLLLILMGVVVIKDIIKYLFIVL